MKKKDRNAKHKVIDESTVPIIKEQIKVVKKLVKGRSVTLSTEQVTETAVVNEILNKQSIEIRREPHNTVVSEIPSVREENGVTVIPVVEERLVVHKELVLVEEIHMVRQNSQHQVTRKVPVTRTKLSVSESNDKKK